jgi:signal transduction histidine kinase
MALLYAGIFSLLSAVGLGFIYWSTADHMEAQIDARLRLETKVLLDGYRTRALPALMETIRQRSRNDGQRKIFFYLLQGPDTQHLAGRPAQWPAGLDDAYATLRLSDVFQVRTGQEGGNDRVRVLATPLPGGYRLLVGRDLNDEQELLEHTLGVVLGTIVVIFLLAMAGSTIMGYDTLRRIDAVSRTANRIVAGDLSSRLPVGKREDEFDQLGREVNAMLARIEQLMAGMRQVADNVAHDLRRPLSRLRNRLEVTLLEARSEEEYRGTLEQTIADADELLKTFNALLSIAQAEAGIRRDNLSAVPLAALVEDLADLYGALAEDKGIDLVWSAALDVQIPGDRRLLAQAVGNLLDNAVKYTPEGGRIELAVTCLDGRPAIVVADTGPGIAADERSRVLERFVRLDSARSTPGSGLGLSLVQAVAQLHGAELALEDNQPGLRVTLCFSGEELARGAGKPGRET